MVRQSEISRTSNKILIDFWSGSTHEPRCRGVTQMRRKHMVDDKDKEVKKSGDVEAEPKALVELSDTDVEKVSGGGGACVGGKHFPPVEI